MKSISLGLSLVGAVVATQVGAVPVTAPPGAPTDAALPVSLTDSAHLGAPTPAPPHVPDAPVADFYQEMPYSAYQNGGYKSLECGYGYEKHGDGQCVPVGWYTPEAHGNGCYAKTIINNVQAPAHCPPAHTVTVTQAVTHVESITVPTTVFVTEFQTATQTDVQILTETQVFTSVWVQPTTKVWVSTEVIDRTSVLEHTLTATETATLTSLLTNFQTLTDTATETIHQVETQFLTQTEVQTIVEPTTYVSVWVSTAVIDNTLTQFETQTATLTEQFTHLQTAFVTQTQVNDVTHTEISTVNVPTTFTSVWVSTEVVDNTQTILNTLTATVTEDQVQTITNVATETATATETEVQQVLETGLSECLGKCKSAWTLQPGNSYEQNTYALPSYSTDAALGYAPLPSHSTDAASGYASLPSHSTDAALASATGSSSSAGSGYYI